MSRQQMEHHDWSTDALSDQDFEHLLQSGLLISQQPCLSHPQPANMLPPPTGPGIANPQARPKSLDFLGQSCFKCGTVITGPSLSKRSGTYYVSVSLLPRTLDLTYPLLCLMAI